MTKRKSFLIAMSGGSGSGKSTLAIALLKRLGAWPLVAPSTEPLDAIRLIDATGALFRAPEVTFHAREIGEEAFGYNVPNAVLTAALEQLAASSTAAAERFFRLG